MSFHHHLINLPLGALVNAILLTGAEAAGLEEPPELEPTDTSGRDGREMGIPDPPIEAVTASPREPAAAPRNVCKDGAHVMRCE